MEEKKNDVAKVDPKKQRMPAYVNFIIAGLSGIMTITICQPMDLLKTRMQLLGKNQRHMNFVGMAQQIFKKEGFKGFYVGISAAWFRQCTYTSTKLGTFNAIFDKYYSKYGHAPPLPTKIGLGMFSGAVGAYVGTPAEVVLIRMTADGRLPPEKRRNYKHVFNALSRIIKEEGVKTLWRGATVTVTRATVVTGAQMSSYTQCRESLLPRLGDGFKLHFSSAMVAGIIGTLISMPFDIVKTRMQNTKKSKVILKVVGGIIKHEGVLGLWSGTLPAYARLGPATVLVFVFMEQLNALYYRVTTGFDLPRVMAICICQPMDLLKTRMQLLGKRQRHKNFINVAQQIVKREGFRGFYAGISAAIFRQCTYTTVRLGLFNAMFDWYNNKFGVPSISVKAALGMASGAVGAYVGTPAEVVVIRMTADGRLPPRKRRNYLHVFDALRRIVQEEGVKALWRGATVGMARATAVNGAQISSYMQARESLLPRVGEGFKLHASSAMFSGIITTLIAMPFDIVKTRTQNAKKAKDVFKIVTGVVKHEGVLGLWRGALPAYARIGPATVLIFVFMEQLNGLYYRAVDTYNLRPRY